MVLADHVDNRARKVVALRKLHAVRHVPLDDLRRDGRVLLAVGVARVAQVLREIGRVGGLSDVVEQRAGPRQERVGAYRVARVLRKLGDNEGVVVGARRLQLHPAQERVVEVGELEQRDVRRPLEESLQHGKEADDRDARQDAGQEARRHLPADGLVRGLLGDADQGGERGDGEPPCPPPSRPARACGRRGTRRWPPSRPGRSGRAGRACCHR